MSGDSDCEAYTEIDMDTSGKPIIPSVLKRAPIPIPEGSHTPPATRPPFRKTGSLFEKTGPLPSIPQQRSDGPLKVRSRSIALGTTTPPPLPPKPPPQLDWDELVVPKKQKRIPISDFIIDSEELNPSSFVNKHQDKFPLKIRVCKGFYGHSDRTSVSEGDTFNIHFVKHTKVVHMLDGGGAIYKIPLNSALEFGIMYDPNQKRDQALNGFVFEKVSELLAAKSMPCAVRTGAAWRGSGASSTIESGEVLLIKGIKKRLNTKTLKVYNLATGKKKELPESCVGKFSTRPYDVRFFLSDIVEHMPNAIPCQAMLFVHSDTASELPKHLVTAVVSLTESNIETSLIATNTEVDDFTDAPMFDIPLDLDIELQVLNYKRPEDTEQLYSDTRTLLEHYNPGKVTQYNASSNVYSIAVMREDNALSGIDIVKPPAIYYNIHEQRNAANGSISSPTKSTIEAIYQMEPSLDSVSTDASDSKMDQRLRTIEETLKQLKTEENSTQVSRQITSARADMKRLESRTGRALEDTVELKKHLLEISTKVLSMQGILTGLCEQVRSLSDQKKGPLVYTPIGSTSIGSDETVTEQALGGGIYDVIPAAPLQKLATVEHLSPVKSVGRSPMQSQASIPESVCEENRQFLNSLDYMQVLKLLELMGLKAYQEAFMAERVNGEVLLECDEDVLLNELKVTSKLRRVRLLKVISGRHSAEQILKGEDPYVYANPH
ncbi:uncharacterized protein LOC135338305 [Halichondria panicea]|uniref:uncharacterized protein LOC135338305 n=1 Tax=Halichondria panicea TaxID=6063 RepID=UPI00312B5948